MQTQTQKAWTPTKAAALRAEALERATTGESVANYDAIYAGFEAMGIPKNEILPRVNVLTFNAWRALGRHVRKGERGVRIFTRIDVNVKADPDDEDAGHVRVSKGKAVTVFHVSQTDPDEAQ